MSLVLQGIRLSYPDGDQRRTVLDDVSLTVEPGELAAVTGPSGSGKSSLLAVAGLLLRQDAGRVLLGGTDATDLKPAQRTTMRRERIGFVFQQANLLPSLTATDQLLAAAHLAGRRPDSARERAAELLGELGLAEVAGQRPHQLSGGQRQRVGIARALMNEPAVLLVDEPTSALDRTRGQAVIDLLAEVTRRRAVATVLVSHDLASLAAVDRVLDLRDGVLSELVSGQRR
ncbi:ABC transporter ATP-binding protein [Solihabitans fulvus]|uniref:ABC transporter ATP-binding protein n=1 Tax=Solihabitans fulvus TaxID=1892852 RepID=A0A5B2WSE6_9PSEU|nr:ABC transporter ATP-binding protein [Solihabitans fulvus]KAA2252867.1 ABC transporter ATP-binding protein [Solihabitans fulvus]